MAYVTSILSFKPWLCAHCPRNRKAPVMTLSLHQMEARPWIQGPATRQEASAGCRTPRVDKEVAWLFPLRSEIHSHSVRAGLGASFTYLIREATLASSAGGVVIQTIVRCCRDNNSIAVDIDVGCGCPPPFQTRGIYSPHLLPLASDVDRARRWRRSCSWCCLRSRSWCAAAYSGQDVN